MGYTGHGQWAILTTNVFAHGEQKKAGPTATSLNGAPPTVCTQYKQVALTRYGAVANEVDGGYSHDLMCLWRAAMLRNTLAGL